MNIVRAFSLLELLIALGIVGILSALVHPAYTSHLLKTHRVEAKITLLNLAAQLEQYHLRQNSYRDASLENFHFNKKSAYHYELQVTPDTFLLRALPLEQQAKDVCGILSYDEKGRKAISGPIGLEECW